MTDQNEIVKQLPLLKFYKVHPDVPTPAFATARSACFDLACSVAGKSTYHGFNLNNAPIDRPCYHGKVFVMPGDRILVPTGLILDIPEGYSLRIHPRSGNALKLFLTLANGEGVIDADYVEELFILITNHSQNQITINNGDRVAQAELVRVEQYGLWEIPERPTQKTDRNGGFGSTQGMSS